MDEQTAGGDDGDDWSQFFETQELVEFKLIDEEVCVFKRAKSLMDFLRYHSYVWKADYLTLSRVRMDRTNAIEYPFFKIEGPELITIGEDSSIGRHAWLASYKTHGDQTFRPLLKIGKHVRIGNYACITCIGEVEIGDGCLISDYVYISDHAHDINPGNPAPLISHPLEFKGNVKIGANCFLGMRSAILPNVTLGNNCVVGSHAVVTKSFPSFSMIAGIPATLIKTYSMDRKKWETA